MKYNKSYLARRLALSLIIGGMFVSSAYALPQGGAVVGGGHAGPGEDHAMLADHVAAAQRGKADIPFAARPDIAVAGAHAALVE